MGYFCFRGSPMHGGWEYNTSILCSLLCTIYLWTFVVVMVLCMFAFVCLFGAP